jgi:hypothetical protein
MPLLFNPSILLTQYVMKLKYLVYTLLTVGFGAFITYRMPRKQGAGSNDSKVRSASTMQ